MGTFSRYSSSKPSSYKRASTKYGSSQARTASRIRRYGGKTEGDRGTRRAGRMESRMQQMRKHRAARRSARKSAHLYRPAQIAAKRKATRTSQRTERRSLYRRQGIMSRRFGQATATAAGGRARPAPAGTTYGGRARPTLRQRAQRPVPRGRYERAGTPRGRDPNRPRGLYGGQQQSSRRREQMREALRDY